jgi:hypothetical protein
MVGCVGNAPTLVRLDIRFTGGSRSLRGYQPEDGCGTWSRTTIEKLMRLLWFSTFPPRWRLGIGRLAGRASRFEMVDRHGFAPCSPACEASDLLNDRAAHAKVVARAGIEPAYWRLMRPLPYLLATPQFESGTASRCCPEPVRFWRPNCASWRPPHTLVCFENWCAQPDLHRHRLIGTQVSCC